MSRGRGAARATASAELVTKSRLLCCMTMQVRVDVKNNKKAAIADARILQGALILSFERNFIPYPTHTTLRVDEHLHQLSLDPKAAENFINHSCEPNAYIEWGQLQLRALRDIEEGEEVTYNYFTSDWDGEDVFECRCSAPTCKKYINGFKHLSPEEKLKIKNLVSPFLAKFLPQF